MRVDLPVVKELNGEETLRHGEGVILPPPKLPPPRTTAFALPCDDGDQQYMLSNSFTELRGGGGQPVGEGGPGRRRDKPNRRTPGLPGEHMRDLWEKLQKEKPEPGRTRYDFYSNYLDRLIKDACGMRPKSVAEEEEKKRTKDDDDYPSDDDDLFPPPPPPPLPPPTDKSPPPPPPTLFDNNYLRSGKVSPPSHPRHTPVTPMFTPHMARPHLLVLAPCIMRFSLVTSRTAAPQPDDSAELRASGAAASVMGATSQDSRRLGATDGRARGGLHLLW